MAQPRNFFIKRSWQKGFTLIEMILFIVIVGIAAGATLLPLASALERMPTVFYQTSALAFAQGRMEFIIGQRRLAGFNYSDPCATVLPAPAGCTLTGYTTSPTPTLTPGATSSTIYIAVSGPNQAQAAQLYSTMSSY